MATSYAKSRVKVPRANPLGTPPRSPKGFLGVQAPKRPSLNTKTYSKAALNQDPMRFGSFGFGNTGLAETPSLLGGSGGSRR